MRLRVTHLEDRLTPSSTVPAGEFNWLQATPSGGLAELVWVGHQLTYRTRAGTGWDEEAVLVDNTSITSSDYNNPDAVQSATQMAQLAFTPDGTPHVFTMLHDLVGTTFNWSIVHHRRDAGGWALAEKIVIGDHTPGTYFIVSNLISTVGPNGVFHLVVQRTTIPVPISSDNLGSGPLIYVTNKTGSWTVETAVTTGDLSQDVFTYGQRYMPRFLSIAADSQNFAHITYSTGFFIAGSFGTVRSNLGYATNRTGTWVGETVFSPPDGTGDAGLGASVAIAPGDVPAIASFFVDRAPTGSPASSQLLFHTRSGGGWAHSVAVAGPDGYVAGDGPLFTGFAPQLRFEGGTPAILFTDMAGQHLASTFANEMSGNVRETRLLPTGWATFTVLPQSNPLVNQAHFPVVAIHQGKPIYAVLLSASTLDGNLDATGSTYSIIELNAPVIEGAEPGLPGGPPGAGAVAADSGGGPVVKIFNDDGTRAATFFAFDANFTGGVRIPTPDVNNDGIEDVIAGTGPGAPTRLRVFSGVNQSLLLDIAPFEASFLGGVYVAAGDLTGDGIADIVVSPDEGGGPRVQVFRGGDFALHANFFGIDDPNFRGGARTAVGDVDNDGRADLIVAAGFGGGPRVAGYSGRSVGGDLVRVFPDFFLFEQQLRNGAFVALGDVTGDGFADLIGGGGPGGGPRVLILSGSDLGAGVTGAARVVANFFAGNADNRGGVRVSTEDLDGDNKADVLAGAGQGNGSRVQAYLGTDLEAGDTSVFRGFFAFPGFSGGVFVG